MGCHAQEAADLHDSVHYQWQGPAPMMTHGPAVQGKLTNAFNSYCINIMGNWGACGACHIGLGAQPSVAFQESEYDNLDCLMCHQKDYKRVKVNGVFVPDTANMAISMDQAVQTVHLPTRQNCLQCHAKAGGGDAFKRGDLALAHANTSDRNFDVHMSTGGGNLTCQTCHTMQNHKFAGRGSDLREIDLNVEMTCTQCHTNKLQTNGHATADIGTIHVGRVACQACHIPLYGKNAADTAATEATETFRTWKSTLATAPPYHPAPTLANNLVPQFKFWNRKNNNYLLGDAAVLDPATGCYGTSRPEGAIGDADTKLYPFKYKTAEQPMVTRTKQLVAVDTSVFFATHDATAATQQGMVNMGLSAAEPWEWVKTDTYQMLNHEIAPASQAVTCAQCHTNKTQVNLPSLGYTLKAAQSTVCSQCHGNRTSPGFTQVHSIHVAQRNYDCSRCHSFSRPERGLR